MPRPRWQMADPLDLENLVEDVDQMLELVPIFGNLATSKRPRCNGAAICLLKYTTD